MYESAYEFYVGLCRNIGRRINYGTNVFEESWDVLIVLDACRWDLMREVTSEYDFVDETTTYSIASSSEEWMKKTFGGVDTSNVGYVTANPFSRQMLDGNDFLLLDEVWEYAVGDEVQTIPADAVTDRSIRAHRERDPDRLIAHYMQPHYPFVPNPMDKGLPLEDFGNDNHEDIWDKLRRGKVSREEVWENYRANLKYVLDSVETLLGSVDGSVVITADHGNLLGDFGLYGHPDYVPAPALKRVPWCRTHAEDDGTYEPAEWTNEFVENDREELLRNLGYR
jgi:hypothetical protein